MSHFQFTPKSVYAAIACVLAYFVSQRYLTKEAAEALTAASFIAAAALKPTRKTARQGPAKMENQ